MKIICIMTTLLLIVHAASSQSLYHETGVFSGLFTTEQYESMMTKRIRREIRNVSDDQWDRIVNAMNIMKYIPEDVGKQIYGDYYRNYDNMVCQHAIGSFDPLGDMAHVAPIFPVWHRAYINSFENSLIAIDPEIEGLPYWDYRIDQVEQNDTVDLSDSIIFSDDYFGDYHNDFAVTNGRFGHWTVHDNPSEVGCDTEYQNPFGLLRAKDNTEGNPFITRFGGSLCDANTFSTGDMDAYNECFNVTGLTAFMGCYNFRVHARTHIGVGGSRPSFSNQTVGNWPSCTSYHDGSFIVFDGVRQFGRNWNCFEYPEPNSCTFDPDDPFGNYDCAVANVTNMVNGTATCNISETIKTFTGDRLSQHTFGDFLDLATSPNDPLFIFHHANLDRYVMEWQLYHYDDAPYYGYPETGYLDLLRLDDTIAPDYPFEYLFYDDMVDLLGNGPYTTRDIWDGTTFVDAVYVYDTVLNMVQPDDDDEGDIVAAVIVIAVTVAIACFICLGLVVYHKKKDNDTSSSGTGSGSKTSHAAVNSTASNGTAAESEETEVQMA